VYVIFGKRFLDLLLGICFLILASPLMLAVAVLVRIRLGSPVLFRQQRPGRDGRSFDLLKFRTMTNTSDEHGHLLPDHARLGPFGRRLRSTSPDELPELINVLRGDMSLVGPRPLLMEYLPLYSSSQARRHEVRPGITGWAQINGRNSISWPEKFELDLWYVDHVSFGTDMKVMWRTFLTVIGRRGINAQDGGTMPPFTG